MATNDDPPPIISITLQIMSQTSNFLFCPMTEWLLGVTSNNARWPKQSKADMTIKGPLHLYPVLKFSDVSTTLVLCVCM